MGVFADWQPIYEAHGIPTFPVRVADGDKKPAVSGYLKIGPGTSRKLVSKFSGEDSFGFALKRARITILDVDTPDERVLADALDQHGPTPLVVRTGSGNWQAWYRHGGEPRRVRPWAGKPIDILGDGFTVAPPSRGGRGWYRLIEGTLDDLERLPPMRAVESLRSVELAVKRIGMGNRNNSLFRHCLGEAPRCASIGELLERAIAYSEVALSSPLPRSEVECTVKSVWAMTERGDNWVGSRGLASLSHDLVDRYAGSAPDALAVLLKLKRHHWGRPEFILSRAMAGSLGWTERRFMRARNRLVSDGELRCLHPGGRGNGDPPRYAWPGAPNPRHAISHTNEK